MSEAHGTTKACICDCLYRKASDIRCEYTQAFPMIHRHVKERAQFLKKLLHVSHSAALQRRPHPANSRERRASDMRRHRRFSNEGVCSESRKHGLPRKHRRCRSIRLASRQAARVDAAAIQLLLYARAASALGHPRTNEDVRIAKIVHHAAQNGASNDAVCVALRESVLHKALLKLASATLTRGH